MNITEGVVLGLAVVGAVCAGNAAQRIAAEHGCTGAEQMGASCVAVGLSMAVLPAAACGGAGVIITKGYDALKNRTSIIASAKARTAATMAKFHGKKPLATAA